MGERFELLTIPYKNGTTYCNKAIRTNGKYQALVHIAACGTITWNIHFSCIPKDVLSRIFRDADKNRKLFNDRLSAMSQQEQYEFLLDEVSDLALDYITSLDESTESKISRLKNLLYTTYTV